MHGSFNDWNGTLVGEPGNLAGGSVNVAIKTASIDTNNERRDNHLRSDEFLDAANHPTITFRSKKVEVKGEDLRVMGDLTIRGVTKLVVLEGKYTGMAPGPQGKPRIGFEASTKINRQNFGVAWNRAAEGGGVMLGDEVEIAIVVAAVRQ